MLSILRNYARIAWLLILGMFILFLDFASKAYVYHVLPFFEAHSGSFCHSIPIFYNIAGIDLAISLATNKGAAWGFFADFQMILLAVRIVVIFGMLLYLFFLNRNPQTAFPLIFIIAGAIGNVVDFFLYGFVVDFIQFNFWGYHFPIFNFADTAITLGVIWLFFMALFTKKYVRV